MKTQDLGREAYKQHRWQVRDRRDTAEAEHWDPAPDQTWDGRSQGEGAQMMLRFKPKEET